MQENRIPKFELLFLIIGEIAVSFAVALIYLLLNKLVLAVALGALLGSAVTVVNFLILVITTNRTIDKVMAERGDAEMSEEEAAVFAEKHKAELAAAQKISYFVRTISVALALVLALLLKGVFDVIATVVPLLMYRPLLTVSQLVKAKINKN
jgi:hypothetical protein